MSKNDHKGHEVKAIAKSNGNTMNPYGGKGAPDGPGHGHTEVSSDGNIVYHRDPKN